jgi:predicted transcriptional regulator
VEEVRTSLQTKRKQFRTLYEIIFNTPRIKTRDIASLLKIDRNTASRRIKEAYDTGYVSRSQIRKHSFKNLREYVYFIQCEDPVDLFMKFREDETIVYHATISGFANMWAISKKRIDVEGDIIVEGIRSDYHLSFVPDHTWEKAIHIMEHLVDHFDPDQYEPKKYIHTRLDQSIKWDTTDEILFKELKYGLRKSFTQVTQTHSISWRRMYDWLERMPECCSIHTNYYPETISSYDPYLFMMETDYEDFIIGLFSQLPTTAFFFKVDNRLFFLIYVRRKFLRIVDPKTSYINHMYVPLLLNRLRKKGITKNNKHALAEDYWSKED